MLEQTKNFTNGDRLQLMLRETTYLAGLSRYWIALACVVLAVTIAAPFDSGEEFGPVERFFYWFGILGVTVLPTIVLSRSWAGRLIEHNIRADVSSLFAGLLVAIPVGLVVFLINSFVAGNDDGEANDLVRIIIYCAPICMSLSYVACILPVLDRPTQRAPSGAQGAALERRLSADVRGTVISVQAQGHYVNVTTSKGSQLILMRISDAASELDRDEGFQVHRSWWINASVVEKITRDGHRMAAHLRDGQIIPVGRSFQRDMLNWWTQHKAPEPQDHLSRQQQ